MENVILVIILVALAALGIYSAVRHFKGQGGCGGGGDCKMKRKKLSNVLYVKTFKVEGMRCEHCKSRVEEAVNDINGVAGKVELKNGELTVLYAQRVDDSLITSRLERLGYTVCELHR